MLLTHYLQAGNQSRLYAEHSALLDEEDFDLDAAGARILGRDLAAITHGQTRAQLEQILAKGLATSEGEPLIRALPLDATQARRLLEALQAGLREA